MRPGGCQVCQAPSFASQSQNASTVEFQQTVPCAFSTRTVVQAPVQSIGSKVSSSCVRIFGASKCHKAKPETEQKNHSFFLCPLANWLRGPRFIPFYCVCALILWSASQRLITAIRNAGKSNAARKHLARHVLKFIRHSPFAIRNSLFPIAIVIEFYALTLAKLAK